VATCSSTMSFILIAIHLILIAIPPEATSDARTRHHPKRLIDGPAAADARFVSRARRAGQIGRTGAASPNLSRSNSPALRSTWFVLVCTAAGISASPGRLLPDHRALGRTDLHPLNPGVFPDNTRRGYPFNRSSAGQRRARSNRTDGHFGAVTSTNVGYLPRGGPLRWIARTPVIGQHGLRRTQ
jgi:hypothetical protein